MTTTQAQHIRYFEVLVKDDGEYHPITVDGKAVFDSRAAAQKAMAWYRNEFPFRLVLKIRELGD